MSKLITLKQKLIQYNEAIDKAYQIKGEIEKMIYKEDPGIDWESERKKYKEQKQLKTEIVYEETKALMSGARNIQPD